MGSFTSDSSFFPYRRLGCPDRCYTTGSKPRFLVYLVGLTEWTLVTFILQSGQETLPRTDLGQ